ncbi:MAG TPA: hypothetical protein VMS86_12255 [Thermoanaerobaculia bacterium]|nr:hypothetical protein [Thermoanaerobaculia bacterium]
MIVSDEEAESFRRAAEREGTSLSEWARRSLTREARRHRGPDAQQVLDELERALACGHPTGDIDQMLKEIEAGRALR